MATWKGWLGVGCLLWALGGSAGSAAADDAAAGALVEQVMGGVQWGMSPADVLNQIKVRIRERYADDLAAASGLLERDEIQERARREFHRIKDSYTKFDGDVTGWTVSAIGPEFRHGSEEAMLVMDDEQHRDFFFFIRGKLWKCYRRFEPEAFARKPFNELVPALVQRLGRAEVQLAARSEDSRPQRFALWETPGAQLEAIDGGTHLILVATERATLARLAQLRRNARSRKPREHTILNGVLMTEEELEVWRSAEHTYSAK